MREEETAEMLPLLATRYGHVEPPVPKPAAGEEPYALEEIYDDELENLVASIYQRDYMMFGFGPWKKT